MNIKTITYIIIFFFTLFFPTKYFYSYHIMLFFVILSASFILDFLFKSFEITNFIRIFIFFILLIFISACLSALYFDVNLYRNLSEVFRFIPIFIFIIFFRGNYAILSLSLRKTLFLYSIIACTVSLCQFYEMPFVNFITDIYGDVHHIDISLRISSRALGLSTGPGQNGAIMAIIYSISIGYISTYGELQWIIIAIMSFITVVLSQSQTAFVVSVGISFYSFLCVVFWKKKINLKNLTFQLLLFLSMGLFFISIFLDKTQYLFTLFSMGLERNAYQARLLKSRMVIDMILENPIFLILGHGKDYFDSISASMDNELLFYVAVYGLFTSFFIFLFYFRMITQPFKNKIYIENPYFFPLHLSVVSGVVLAYPSAFILDPRILFLLSVLYILSLKIKYCGKNS